MRTVSCVCPSTGRSRGRLAIVATAAARREFLGIAEILHDRLLPAARTIRVTAHQVELILSMPLPLFLLFGRNGLDGLPVEKLVDRDIARTV